MIKHSVRRLKTDKLMIQHQSWRKSDQTGKQQKKKTQQKNPKNLSLLPNIDALKDTLHYRGTKELLCRYAVGKRRCLKNDL